MRWSPRSDFTLKAARRCRGRDAGKGYHPIAVPPLVAAKLALYDAMRAEGMTGAKLARKLKVADTTVRRLLDLDHRSHIEEVERALEVLGRRLVVSVARDAA